MQKLLSILNYMNHKINRWVRLGLGENKREPSEAMGHEAIQL